MQFELPILDYDYDKIEPFIDEETMMIHHQKHHGTYVKNLNKELSEIKNLKHKSLEELLENISNYSVNVRNNGGGHFNHSMFWKILSPTKQEISDAILLEINKYFGDYETFKKEFISKSMSLFGSGWVWLIKKNNNKLEIITTPNQDNPLMDVVENGGTPVLCLDLWEHAYYLKYQNKRSDYVNSFFDFINWEEVSKNIFG